jgi:C_GCAxxG_C_C family probable redox protein
MTSRAENAVTCFKGGFNCAQAVFSTYAPLLGIEAEKALAIARGFGAGMGRTQEVCGAVTGAFMLIGLAKGMPEKNDSAAKEETYRLVQEFSSRFAEANGSTLCKTLLGCNLLTEEGQRFFKEKDLHNLKCVKYVRDCARMVEESLFPA